MKRPQLKTLLSLLAVAIFLLSVAAADVMTRLKASIKASPAGWSSSFCREVAGGCDPQVSALIAVAGGFGYPVLLTDSWKGNEPCGDQSWSFVSCDRDGNVVTLNFMKQHFFGTISPALANLTMLQSVFLSDNNLTGPIPDALAKMPQLKTLDVSNNNLTGKVPDFPAHVTVTTSGNSLLWIPLSPGSASGTNDTSSTRNNKVSAGMIAEIVIAAIVFVLVVVFVSFNCYVTNRHMKFGRDENPVFGGGSQKCELQRQSNRGDFNVYEVLRQVTNNFGEANILGRGGSWVVYRGEMHDGTKIAVKRMESSNEATKGMSEFRAEIAVLAKVRHRHLVALLGYCINGNERLLVYEYMPHGTLTRHLFQWDEKRLSPLTWKQRVTIALDVARGVEYLHSLAQTSFIHRDLKPSNILLREDMRAKVANFGLVKNTPDGKYSVQTRMAGTFGYLPPEYATTGRVTTKVDVYAFGVVLMELITGRKAIDNTVPDERSHLVTWFKRVLVNKEDIPKAIDQILDPDEETMESIYKVAKLAGHCTAREPYQRPDMGHAVNILGPLVEQWKPIRQEEEENFGIDLHMSLPQAFHTWQGKEGSSTMFNDMYFPQQHVMYFTSL